jgi:hypothetical protein
MRSLAVAVLAVTLGVLPDVALAAHGQPHGPSSTPLVAELLVAAAVAIGVLGRHAAARLVRSAAHVSVDAFRSLTHHLPRARHPSA